MFSCVSSLSSRVLSGTASERAAILGLKYSYPSLAIRLDNRQCLRYSVAEFGQPEPRKARRVQANEPKTCQRAHHCTGEVGRDVIANDVCGLPLGLMAVLRCAQQSQSVDFQLA